GVSGERRLLSETPAEVRARHGAADYHQHHRRRAGRRGASAHAASDFHAPGSVPVRNCNFALRVWQAADPEIRPGGQTDGTSFLAHPGRPHPGAVLDCPLWGLLWRRHGHPDVGDVGDDPYRRYPRHEWPESAAGFGHQRRGHGDVHRGEASGVAAGDPDDCGRDPRWIWRRTFRTEARSALGARGGHLRRRWDDDLLSVAILTPL